MKFIIDKKIKSTIPSTKVFDLGSINEGTINELLDTSIINIDQNIIPILKIENSNYLINDWNSKNIKESFELELTEDNLISLAGTPEPIDSRPYKVYTALLTQSGTDAPVATVLENTLGATITTSYIAVGVYRLISDIPVFTINKTYSPQDKKGFEDDNSGLVKVLRLNLIDDTTMDLRSSGSNDALANQFIEIRVYN